VTRLVVVAPLEPGKRGRVEELLAAGPPFALEKTEFDRHLVFLTDHEAVFVFEGVAETATLRLAAEDPDILVAAREWQKCLAARPRVAQTAFSWERSGSS
jgi:hypothetical protein